MPPHTQAHRPLKVHTPLGADALLLVGFKGREAVSELFNFELELLAANATKIAFDKLIGRNVTVSLEQLKGKPRFFNGIVSRFSQGGRDEDFTKYRARVVPQFWLWTNNWQSRIFQHLSVPDILKKVLTGLKVVYDFHGAYQPRDYCSQYRESDFAFASRLMEEEGIRYFFNHTDGNHEMVVTDDATHHPDVPIQKAVVYDEVVGGTREDLRVTVWEKTQEMRSGKYTLWDSCFELPGQNLEAEQHIQESVAVGKVTHHLKVGGNDKLEIYDYPGGYAQRFDGIDKGGAPKAADLQNIFHDNDRTAKIRMQQEALPSLAIDGASTCGNFTAGHQFTLQRHFDADGLYLLTAVEHTARLAFNYRSGDDSVLEYTNGFSAIPVALPYRPQQDTPKPVIDGTQTATVVGPKGEEIFCDKYGRVKVQFHWDRHGTKDPDSSCWVRVSQAWAGGNFGAICIPRVGQEVVVAYDEGDPDAPVILGSVYNAGQMPPFTLPDQRTLSTIKSKSVGGKPGKNYSGIAFDDKPGSEHTALYAEKDMLVNAENNNQHHVGVYQHAKIGKTSLSIVGGLPGLGGTGGGGGSGGGGANDTTQANDPNSKAGSGSPGNWKSSDGLLAATPGLSGGTVYGINSQDTVGFMHQIIIGQLTQVFIDPLNSWGHLTGGTFGSVMQFLQMLGGSQQLFWGTNYSSTYGASIQYNDTAQVSLSASPGVFSGILAIAIPVLCVAYEITYAVITDTEAAKHVYEAWCITLGVANALLINAQKLEQAKQATKDQGTVTEATAKVVVPLTKALSAIVPAADTTIISASTALLQVVKDKPLTAADAAHNVTIADGAILEVGGHIHLIARQDPTSTDPVPSSIYLNAYGKGTDGSFIIHGTKSVSLTSGMVAFTLEDNTSAGKVTLNCDAAGTIVIANSVAAGSPLPGPAKQSIFLDNTSITLKAGALVSAKLDQTSITLESAPTVNAKMDATSIALTAGAAHVTLDATAGVTLKFGLQSIVLGTDALKIDGTAIKLTAIADYELQTHSEKITATVSNITRSIAIHK